MQTHEVRERFTTFPGKCFRYVGNDDDHAQPCPNGVVCTGTFTDANGKRWTVDACSEHAEELAG
jgi:hypothetical protein